MFGKNTFSVYLFIYFDSYFCSVLSLNEATEHRKVEFVLEGGFDTILQDSAVIQTKVSTLSNYTPSDAFR